MPTAMRRRVERFGAADIAVHWVDWVTIPAVVSCTLALEWECGIDFRAFIIDEQASREALDARLGGRVEGVAGWKGWWGRSNLSSGWVIVMTKRVLKAYRETWFALLALV